MTNTDLNKRITNVLTMLEKMSFGKGKKITILDELLAIQKETNSNINIYDEIVKFLKFDVQVLQKKLIKAQESDDFRKSIDIMRNLKDTLELIQKYDWQLMYSAYGSKDDAAEKDFHKEVTVWEQNTEGNIRNHKVWTVIERIK